MNRRLDGRKVMGTALLAVAALVSACGEPPPPQPPPQPPPPATVEAPAPPPPAPPQYAFEPVNFHTGELQILPNMTDPQACARACDQNAQCFVASYHDATVPLEKYRNTCVLRGFVGERITQPGISSWIKAGAPPAPPPVVVERVVVNEGRIQLNEEILFKTGSADIDPRSDDFVRYVAHVLKEHEGLDFIEVAGHTDKTGAPGDNVKLSQARADAVVKHLAADGVDPKRLRGVGYGPYCPVDAGDSAEALKKNRRVEFVILRRNGHNLPAKWDGCDAAAKVGMKPIAIPASAPKTKEFVVKKAKIVRKGGELVFSDQVRFEPSTAKIVPATEPALEALKVFLDKDKAITKVRIEGHTDPPNSPEMVALSKARSKKVAEWLVNHGIEPSRIVPVGCGGARPVLKGGHVDSRLSRRTEAHVIEEKGKAVSATPVPADCSVD